MGAIDVVSTPGIGGIGGICGPGEGGRGVIPTGTAVFVIIVAGTPEPVLSLLISAAGVLKAEAMVLRCISSWALTLNSLLYLVARGDPPASAPGGGPPSSPPGGCRPRSIGAGLPDASPAAASWGARCPIKFC